MESSAEMIDLMTERAYTYRFLARAYQTAPDQAFIESVLSTAGNDPLLAEFYHDAEGVALDQLRIDLAADYNRLFLGMSANPVSPYESVYTSEERMMMQEARDAIVRVFKEVGVTTPDEWHLPEDHIALEFELVAILAERAVDALVEKRGEEVDRIILRTRSFEEEHFGWIDEFCNQVSKQATTSFYRGLAAITKDIIEADKELLAEML